MISVVSKFRLAALALPLALPLSMSCQAAHPASSELDTEVATASALLEIEQGRNSQSKPAVAPPAGLGFADTAPIADESLVPPFVDFAYTNQRGDARYSTVATNAGVRVVAGFLALWQPTTLLVDAGVSAPASDGFPAITPSLWTGIPRDRTDGTVLNAAALDANLKYVVNVTSRRTAAQELSAYLDDRRGKAYSVSDGMGPLTLAWRTATGQTTTIVDIPADATTVKYDDKGKNSGVGGSANPTFGAVVDFVNNIGENGSTEPAKRFFKYARPWRWTTDVKIPEALVPVESTTPNTDGGFISGHAAEAFRNAVAFSYVVPERFQEMFCRAAELGENRILAGMHSPLDVMGGRIQALAVAAASLNTGANRSLRAVAYDTAHSVLAGAVGATTPEQFIAFAHSQGLDSDRFADHDANKAIYRQRLTYGFARIGDTTKSPVVPKGAEVLLETRFPYLDANQRRVVLKTTALRSGYPLLDDTEGWGRLNLFDAADGYGAFNGDVVVTMQSMNGGFSAQDTWRNNISGAGKLTKKGSGALNLTGGNSYTGGTHILEGTLRASSSSALGRGDVYVGGGKLVATSGLLVDGDYTQLAGTGLELAVKEDGCDHERENDGMRVEGKVTIMGGTLRVKLPASSARHQAPKIITVLHGKRLQGQFASIDVEGGKAIPFYGANDLRLLVWR